MTTAADMAADRLIAALNRVSARLESGDRSGEAGATKLAQAIRPLVGSLDRHEWEHPTHVERCWDCEWRWLKSTGGR